MSGRIRSIKPELLEDAVTAGLSDTAFRIFIGCILIADDYGVFRAEERFIHGQVFWKREPSGNLPVALEELSVKLVQFFDVGGQRYGFIRGWFKHQKVSHPGKRRLPEPPPDNPPETIPPSSGDSPESLVPDLRPSTIDHRPGPSTPTGARRESAGESSARLMTETQRDGLFGMTADVWRSSLAKATGRPVAPLSRREQQDLQRLIAGHAGGLQGEALMSWVDETAAAWGAAAEPRYGMGPHRAIAWLDGGRPPRAATNGRPSLVQNPPEPGDYDWKTKVPDAASF